MPRMVVEPSEFDVFRNDLLDIPEQECTGDIECAVRDILAAIGEDVEREGLLRTPNRVARMYEELTAGYHVDPVRLINDAIFDVEYDEMVIVRNIDYYSMCEHHMLPFLGQAHVAYIPDGKVIGLSKIPRIVTNEANSSATITRIASGKRSVVSASISSAMTVSKYASP